MERTVLLTGYYGFGNTGDEAILSALVAGLRARLPDARIRVLSGDPLATRTQHGVEAVPWRDPLSISEEVRKSDLVVVGGGGLFQDYAGVDPSTLLTPRHGGITFYAGPAVLASLARKPFALYGVGVGPLATPKAREIVRALGEAAAFLSVRDAGSRALVAASGVPPAKIHLSADPAFLLVAERVRPEDVLLGTGIEPRAPIVGAALRPWAQGVDPAVWEAELAEALGQLLDRTGGTLLLVPFERSPWSPDDDFAVASRILRRLDRPGRAAALSGVLPPAETAGLLAGCDLVLAMRLHAGIFAISGAAPTAAVSYDPKVDALFAGAGLGDFVEPLSGLSATGLLARMENALAGGEPLRAALAGSAAKSRKLAAADLDVLAALLENPPAAAPIGPAMLSLVDEALSANLLRTHELTAQVQIQTEDRRAQTLKLQELEARQAEAEAKEAALRASEAALRASEGELARRLDAESEARRKQVALLEGQGAEAREELYRIQTSRFWKTINLYWRARRVAARLSRPLRKRLSGSPPSDWVGADSSAREATAAPSPQVENGFDVVCFAPQASVPPQVRRLTESGHRVFIVSPATPGQASAPPIVEGAPNLFTLSLPPPDKDSGQSLFDALDDLRREHGLGATVALALDPAYLPVAIRLRAERGWPLFTEPVEADAMARAFPKLSVVVVTWNGRDYNRLCLESLIARTEWPQLEILVVDNASTDGTLELLAELSRRDPRVTVLRNAENRGFAAAANQGLAAATGEYLAILNNDTVVTRGWATALVRHLAADPKLGLVGPVTNAIANAARVDVGYARVADLPAWASDWVRTHDGEIFDIRMLALFCAALPRRVFEEVGPLDERFGTGMFEDNDYSRRVRAAGYDVRCARDAFVHHWQMASFRKMPKEEYFALFAENRRKFEEKWGEAGEVAPPTPAPAGTGGFATLEEHRAQLQNVLARVAASKGAIVFLPSVGWGIHLFQRPHHLARVFARLGYVAIFDSSNAMDRVDGFREIEPNLFLFSGSEELLHEVPSPVLWAFPYNFHHKDGYPPDSATVYDWIDDLDVFPQDRDLLERNHARGLAEATIVASVAQRLHEQALAKRPDALYLPNGVEYERFAAPAPPPRDEELLSFLPRGAPVAGYYGALAEWFDYALLDAVAASKPDWRFVLIGPQYDKSLPGQPLLSRENVRWLGPRDYVSLPGYLSLFDVATIPFRINPITLATSPLKLFEYFAGGKPVVTTPMPECQTHPEVRIAASPAEFSAALDAALADGRDPAFRARLRSLARANSWETRVRTVVAALERVSGHPRPGKPLERASLAAMSSLEGRCNICGRQTRFRYTDPALYRESLVCESCLSTSRYRSIARGLLEAFRGLAGVEANSLAELPGAGNGQRLRVYDTQVAFSTGASAYPIPGFLEKCSWIDLATSTWRPDATPGQVLGPRVTNQNLESLAFPDASFDVVVTSDVLEHVRLEDAAHREIRRVLKPGGVYLFTVPHFRDRPTVHRVEVVDPADPSRDVDLLEREYHGDANSAEGRALAYRSFGSDLDEKLSRLGFSVEYTKRDFPEAGILNTELFFCRVVGPAED